MGSCYLPSVWDSHLYQPHRCSEFLVLMLSWDSRLCWQFCLPVEFRNLSSFFLHQSEDVFSPETTLPGALSGWTGHQAYTNTMEKKNPRQKALLDHDQNTVDFQLHQSEVFPFLSVFSWDHWKFLWMNWSPWLHYLCGSSRKEEAGCNFRKQLWVQHD